jgi:hypothetical protein
MSLVTCGRAGRDILFFLLPMPRARGSIAS